MRSLLLALICVSALQLAACDNTNNPTPPEVNSPAPPPQEKIPPTNVAPPTTMPSENATPPATQPNNTGINTGDQAPQVMTAAQQSQKQSDIQLLANIRKQVVEDPNLSVTAQNVKIITSNGKVFLRGPVETQAEKDSIGRIAAKLAGKNNVDNELQVENPGPTNMNNENYPANAVHPNQ